MGALALGTLVLTVEEGHIIWDKRKVKNMNV